MTTVVYRNGILAADRQLTRGNGILHEMTKIYRAKDGSMIGGCGASWWIQAIFKWLDTRRGPLPVADDATAIMIDRFGTVTMHEAADDNPVTSFIPHLTHGYTAIGSGADLALGAMAHGASATEAVTAAIRHDVGSGGAVDWLQLRKPRKATK